MNLKVSMGHPGDVEQELKNRIRYVNNKPEVEMFYIGRTSRLSVRKDEHGCDEICPIYKTWSVRWIMDIEERLITHFIDWEKCDNGVDDSRGRINENSVNYLYIAVWYWDD